MANDCLASLPPLTFFQDAVVDESGEESPVFRLERSALRPLVDVGRVFGFAGRRIFGWSTLERLEIAGSLFPEHQTVFREAAETLRIVLWLQGRVGISQGTSGAELPPALVSRHERQLLKSGFRSIHRLLELTADVSWLKRCDRAAVRGSVSPALRSDVGRRRRRIDQVRFVVLDSETTGLNPRVDRLVTIGAVAVQNGEIALDDAFDSLIRVDENTTAVTVHGVTRDESRAGVEEPEALEKFLEYLGDGVIVGHHIDHDIGTFDTAYERHWGFRMSNRSLDTMDLTLHLEKDGAFAGRPADSPVHAGCALRDLRRHPARSPHRERRRLHHRTGLPATDSPRVTPRTEHARAPERAVSRAGIAACRPTVFLRFRSTTVHHAVQRRGGGRRWCVACS